jgi:hypothetical protein
VQAKVSGIFHASVLQEGMPTTEPVPKRLSMKNTHQNTSNIEMPLQTPDTPTSTVGPDDLRIAINLSLLFLHYKRVAIDHAGCDRTPQ